MHELSSLPFPPIWKCMIFSACASMKFGWLSMKKIKLSMKLHFMGEIK
jgi:hypothetical protein